MRTTPGQAANTVGAYSPATPPDLAARHGGSRRFALPDTFTQPKRLAPRLTAG